MQKICDRKNLIKTLKNAGFNLISSAKHEKWSNGKITVLVPNKHTTGKFSRMLAQRILKNANL